MMLLNLENKHTVELRRNTQIVNPDANDISSENTEAAVICKNKIISPLDSEKDIETVRF